MSFKKVTVHINIKFGNIVLIVNKIFLRQVTHSGNFCCSNSMQLLSHQSCNFKIARVSKAGAIFSAISQGFQTCLTLVETVPWQKLHWVATTKNTCVNEPFHCRTIMKKIHTSPIWHLIYFLLFSFFST